jgi:hypothetical protein
MSQRTIVLRLLVCLGIMGFPALAAGAEQAVLQVQPAALELDGPQERHQLLVTLRAADGAVQDVTQQAEYASSQPAVVTVTRTGECQAQHDGTAQVRIRYQGLEASVPVIVRHSQEQRAPSFLNDVLPLLTRVGCNQGACHGKGSGQNGFRLSLRGYAPEWDYQYLTREFASRRVDPTVPEASLILRKPSGQAPHEGGKLFRVGSREYQLLLSWLQAGMPGPNPKERTIRRLELLPGDRLLKVGQEQQLVVRAEYSDGVWRDVTWLAKIESNDASVVEVLPGARLRLIRPGETAVRALFQGLVAVAVFTAPYDQAVRPEWYAQRHNVIDEHVFAKLAALHLEPSEICSDETFLRRVFLDTLGLLPTPAEARAFLSDTRPDKRARLIEQVLQRPEFVDYWTLDLADLFQNRKESDHDVRGVKGVRAFHEWLRQQVASNRPWDELARAVLTARGSVRENPAVGYYIVTVGEHRPAHTSSVVAAVAQTFLGVRIGCAQCHNHPLEKYTQDDYYHFAAFFSRIHLKRKEPQQGGTILEVSTGNPQQDRQPVGVVQPRTGQFLVPQTLDRQPLPVSPGQDPREVLARWITDPQNEYFAGAMVNRLWAHFFGVGLVEPVDDLRASNPPSNPALWRALLQEFVQHRFDRKHLIRLILNSRAYQLSAVPRPGNVRDHRFYSHYYARRLPAEVLLDALSRSTGVPEPFPGYPQGLRAVQLPDPGVPSYFLALFGRPERITACACERNGEVTMPQLLHLQNGLSVREKIAAPEGRLAQLLRAGKSDAEITEELFLATLTRRPTPAETEAVRQALATGDNREIVFRDLFWALLNSREFAFNH